MPAPKHQRVENRCWCSTVHLEFCALQLPCSVKSRAQPWHTSHPSRSISERLAPRVAYPRHCRFVVVELVKNFLRLKPPPRNMSFARDHAPCASLTQLHPPTFRHADLCNFPTFPSLVVGLMEIIIT